MFASAVPNLIFYLAHGGALFFYRREGTALLKHVEEAIAMLDGELESIAKMGERIHEAELLRLRGDLSMRSDPSQCDLAPAGSPPHGAAWRPWAGVWDRCRWLGAQFTNEGWALNARGSASTQPCYATRARGQ